MDQFAIMPPSPGTVPTLPEPLGRPGELAGQHLEAQFSALTARASPLKEVAGFVKEDFGDEDKCVATEPSERVGKSATNRESQFSAHTALSRSASYLKDVAGFVREEFSDEYKLALCRRASKLHFDLILTPTAVVRSRLNTELDSFYDEHNGPIAQRLWIFLFSAVVALLPYTYSKIAMNGSCKPVQHTLSWNDRSAASAKESIDLERSDCDLERRLKSTEGIFWGVGVVLGAYAVMFIMSLMTKLLQCCAGRASNKKMNGWLKLKRLLWRPLLLFWYFWIDPRMPSIKYANEGNMIPYQYTPVSLLCCFMYLGLIFEMLVLGYISNRIATSLLIAYYMGELFLRAGDFVMGASDIVISVTDSEIREWTPKNLATKSIKLEWIPGENTILHKLSKHGRALGGIGPSICPALSHYDLMMLDELPPEKTEKVSDRMAGDNSCDDIGVFSEVWLFADMERVDLFTGRLEKYPKPKDSKPKEKGIVPHLRQKRDVLSQSLTSVF